MTTTEGKEDFLPSNPRPNDPGVTIGGKKEAQPDAAVLPDDWRDWFESMETIRDAPEPSFLIKDFLMENGITAIAAPVAQRKTLIVMNVVHALLTGEKLFGYFEVLHRPKRILYLCPEMGLLSFAKRVRNLDLVKYIGKTLYVRTMESKPPVSLADLPDSALDGAVIILDTAIRFFKGNENDSESMNAFGREVFSLITKKAKSVIVLHHSRKGTSEANDLSLDNAMRGSGDFGAFIASCWATRLQDPKDPYGSASFLDNVKQRDFEVQPFECSSSRETGKMTIIGVPGNSVVLKARAVGPKGNIDGKEDAAVAYIVAKLKGDPKTSGQKLSDGLADLDIKRSPDWCNHKKKPLLKTGVTLSEG